MSPILFDTIIGIVIILSIVIAFFRGFVKEVLTIVNLLAASAAAYYLGDDLTPSMQSWLGAGEEGAEDIMGMIPPDVLGIFLAYAAVFFGTFIILILAGMAIASSIQAMGLGPLDKGLGMLFGAARGYLLVFLLYVPFAAMIPPEKADYPKFFTESLTFIALDKTYTWMDKYTGDEEDKDGKKKPGIITQHLKNMGDDLMREKERTQEDAAKTMDDVQKRAQENRRALPSEILTEEELHAP